VPELETRLDELRASGLYRRMRLIAGPQGPRVTLDGRPVLLLCSNNYLGLSAAALSTTAPAHPALRWGAGAGSSRLVSGTMQVHGALEERLARDPGLKRALLFGSAATGRGYRSDSDIDLAIEGGDLFACMAAAETSSFRVDVVELWRLPPGIRARVEEEGIILYEKT